MGWRFTLTATTTSATTTNKVGCEPEQHWTFDSDADDVTSVHSYFDVLMRSSASELQQIGERVCVCERVSVRVCV